MLSHRTTPNAALLPTPRRHEPESVQRRSIPRLDHQRRTGNVLKVSLSSPHVALSLHRRFCPHENKHRNESSVLPPPRLRTPLAATFRQHNRLRCRTHTCRFRTRRSKVVVQDFSFKSIHYLRYFTDEAITEEDLLFERWMHLTDVVKVRRTKLSESEESTTPRLFSSNIQSSLTTGPAAGDQRVLLLRSAQDTQARRDVCDAA